MKGLVLTHRGLEGVSAEEVKRLIAASDVKAAPGRVLFSCEKQEEVAELCYKGRTFSRVVLVLNEGTIDGVPSPDIMQGIDEFLGKSAVVVCERVGEHDFTSFDVQSALNAELGKKAAIDHKNPQTTFFLLIDRGKFFFGVDFAGMDLGRRDYRIFLGTNALKGTLAAGILLFAGFQAGQKLLDPFCRHGIIPIEAALMATNSSPQKFGKEKLAFTRLPVRYEFKDEEQKAEGVIIAMDDNFKHVSAAKKNAKIAGVTKAVSFSRTDLEWLDAKFGKQFLDRIVTFPAQPGRAITEEKAGKLYHQFFYQAEFILRKDGKVCVCMKRGAGVMKEKAKEFGFLLEQELAVWQGQEELQVILFSKP